MPKFDREMARAACEAGYMSAREYIALCAANRSVDYGYQHGLHVVDYYIHRIMQYKPGWLVSNTARDFDIETERREGWTYADTL